MTLHHRPRRLVVWADFTTESDRAARWAARHAEARALPLHLLRPAETAALVGAVDGRRPGAFLGDQPDAVDTVRLARQARRIHALHRDVAVTVQIAEGDRGRPTPGQLEPGDVLVTGPFGYRELTAGPAPSGAPNGPLSAPIVVVPGGCDVPAARPSVLLLTPLHPARAVTGFAFAAAADLGADLDVVRVAPASAAFGDDYWVDETRLPYRAESRLKAELDTIHHHYPQVAWNSTTLRVRPWRTLRAMADNAQLAVLPVDHASAAAVLGALLDAGSCPVALVPSGG